MTGYDAPESLDQAVTILAQHGDEAKIIAGGTALVILMKQGLVQPAFLVGVGRISGFAQIAERDGWLSIGPGATHRAVETSAFVAARFPVLVETLRSVATVRIRNIGTLGGNLAHADPALDPPVTLMALDARVRLVGPGEDRVLPLESFFVDYYQTALRPGELLAEIQVPFLPPRSAIAFRKFHPRTADDYATVAVAARLTLDPAGSTCEDVRITLGAVGSTTIRAIDAEAAVRGQPATEATFREAAAIASQAADPLSDIRGSASYKREMVQVWVRRALADTLSQLGGDRRGS